jgi:hypothetical protein
MPITGAILGAGALSAGASAYGASQAAGASKSGLAQQQAQLDKVWSSVNPWLTAGQGALQKLQSPAASFEASPDYNFVKGEALNGVVQNKAVNGLLRSGSALTAVQNRAANLGSTEFGNWWNRQSGLATQGLDANRGNRCQRYRHEHGEPRQCGYCHGQFVRPIRGIGPGCSDVEIRGVGLR